MEILNYLFEEWRDIKGYEGLYQVSNYGRIKSYDRYVKHNKGGLALRKGRIIYQSIDNNGYHRVCLANNTIHKTHLVHRLVAFAFQDICGKWFKGAECNHKDENPENNCALNLEWCTKSFNMGWGTGNERRSKNKTGKYKPRITQQYDLNGNLIKEWVSATSAGKAYGHSIHIVDCCNGKRNKAYGYIWRYKKGDA